MLFVAYTWCGNEIFAPLFVRTPSGAPDTTTAAISVQVWGTMYTSPHLLQVSALRALMRSGGHQRHALCLLQGQVESNSFLITHRAAMGLTLLAVYNPEAAEMIALSTILFQATLVIICSSVQGEGSPSGRSSQHSANRLLLVYTL